MNDDERQAALDRIREFADQQHNADELADQGSLDRGADITALYEDRHWVTEIPAPKVRRSRGRPVDPESFSRFTQWLADKTPLSGRHAYRLRDAHVLHTNYLTQGQIKPTGERELRPLKWMEKNGYGDRIPEVWKIATELADQRPPDNPTVRKALAQWKKDNGLTPQRKSGGKRGPDTEINAWMREAERLMQEYPERFNDALDKIEDTAERVYTRKAAA